LTYVDVVVKPHENEPGFALKALSDTGAQISVLDVQLLGSEKMDSLGKIKLQPFCGEPIEADWVKLSIAPVTGQCDDIKCMTTDCAIVPNLNKNMILTANVIWLLSQCNHKQQNDGVCDDVENTVVVGDENVVRNNDYADNVRPITNVVDEVDSQNAVVDHNTVVASDSLDDMSIIDFASCEQVAQKQKKDETLKGSFSLATAGKSGFLFQNGLLYHKKTVLGESFLQLVIFFARRKQVLELGHSVSGVYMAVKRTR